LDIKPKPILNEVSKEIGLIYPKYRPIKFQIIRNINKQSKSCYNNIWWNSWGIRILYNKKKGEDFMIFKNHNL